MTDRLLYFRRLFLLACFIAIGSSASNLIDSANTGQAAAAEIYMSPDGDDQNAGTKNAPLKSLAAAADAVLACQPGPGQQPITVWISGGRYATTDTVTFDKRFAGTRENPITFRAVEGEVPVFDSGISVSLENASPAESPDVIALLPASQSNQVFSQPISSNALRSALRADSASCSVDGHFMKRARYPNVGFGYVDKIIDKGAEYAHGRTPGNPPKWSIDDPIGGRFTVRNKDVSAWQRELQNGGEAKVSGYLAYDWYRETHPVASVENGQVRLADYARYGVINKSKVPRRFIISNLLCELDAPGEFFFDERESVFYFIPGKELHAGSILSVHGGPGPFRVDGAAFVAIENIVVEGVGKGSAAVEIASGTNVVLAGCTIRNSSRPGVVINGGERCGLRSCDIYDVVNHLTLGGGDVRKLKPGKNFAINCHFTQVNASDYYGAVRLRGVGNVFRHNLLHNAPGQLMTFGDCDQLIERNEFFNIGYEEGDGGAIYSGAAMWSWGNVIRHNFIHHLMCIPQLHPRGGIYPDDLDQGETIEENVFYKAAHRAVLINGGAGHHVNRNLFLEGYIGIYNTQTAAKVLYKKMSQFESGKLKRGDKADYLYRLEKAIGPEGWNNEPWASRFPLFRKIMNQEEMRYYPIECEFVGNRFANNFRNIEYRVAGGEKGVKDVDDVSFIRSADNREISMKLFRDPNSLDFRYVEGIRTARLPSIPFEQIGLIRDPQYRPTVPNKKKYRVAVKQHFADRASYDPKAVYDPKTINDQLYFNTGKLLSDLGGLIHTKSSDD
ncbi:right-handed parallel beta-helix repeat-containing protein [Rhodopirellula sallentina]|uniref:Putative secreted protein n=1 Tax=Rhodopirellula sallentina SM41 TaxID=1263870 RepID=M5UAZ0_9BACT|nr:right-handed parallel beta-helix repeat-containing protein [Rhodopirellula sallentina]EMI58469.1 putative secreted protein [Rhodopirellula sallentina SM41]